MHSRSTLWILSISLVVMLSIGTAVAGEDAATSAQTSAKAGTTIDLKSPTWQAVLDRLFGTPDSGLLDGTKPFRFRAEDVTLTATQSADFFTSASSLLSLTELIKGAEAVHGLVRMEGTIDGKPFELKIAGRELKLEGLTLTAAQRDALAAELRTIPGLHEAKIEALVDGQRTVTKLEGDHHLKLELLDHDRGKQERPEQSRGDDKQRIELPHIEIDHSVNAELHSSVERGASGRVLERIELPGKH